MELEHLEAPARVGEAEPGWAEVVDSVICDGRPGFLREAAERYEHLLRRMHDEATSMEDELAQLAQSWDGTAFAAYHAAMERIIVEMRETAGKARALVDALRLAADALRSHQERIPVPAKLRGEVFRAHQGRRQQTGGLAPTNADFEQAIHADVVAAQPLLTPAQALEQTAILFEEQQTIARRVYRDLSAAYREVEALLPALPAPPPVVAAAQPVATLHSGGRRWSKVDFDFDNEVRDADDGVIDDMQDEVVDLAAPEVAELPVPVALGGRGRDRDDDDDRDPFTTGNLAGTGTAQALGPGLNDTGAAFGVPVSMMGSPAVSPGMNLGTGMGLHPSTPMSTGYGGVIGGVGEDNTHSTWLTADDEPFEQDGESSGAVLS